MARSRLYCAAPAGIVGSPSVDLFGNACDCESMYLVAAIGAFLMAGHWAFVRWGKQPDRGPAPEPEASSLSATVRA